MASKSLKPFEIPVHSKFGAPMGRDQDDVEDFVGPIYFQKVAFFDGDYDKGGAYWGGGGTPLYCAWDDEGHAIYIRAKDPFAAKKKLPASWKYAGKSAKAKNDLYAEEMLQQYMETALWSSMDMNAEEGDETESTPLDRDYTTDDIARETKAKMLADCQKFFNENRTLLEDPEIGWPADQAGHEFWLTRGGHGTGFFDSKYGTDESRDALAKACRKYGEVNLYVERGKIHQDR
jgi:hypothetical protein